MNFRKGIRSVMGTVAIIAVASFTLGAKATENDSSAVEQRHFALEFNPAPLAFARISGNAEALLAPHSALTLSVATQRDNNYVRGTFGEIGYRYYSRRGIKGFFATASVIGGTYEYHTNGSGAPPWANSYQLGVAVDAGYQHQFDFGLLVGAGAGLQLQYSPKRTYELYDSDFTPLGELLINSGLRPRALMWVGYAF